VIPTLLGRISTRIFVLAIVGSIVQLIFTPILPGTDGAPLGTLYKATFGILIATIVLGIGWEFIYHGLMQFRWEKDWPTLFGFVTVINEGALVWGFVKWDLIPGVPKELPFSTFVTDFLLVWMISFLWVNGPMRVPFVRWLHTGGRLFNELPSR
jgi:hypothetical protein